MWEGLGEVRCFRSVGKRSGWALGTPDPLAFPREDGSDLAALALFSLQLLLS